MMVVIVRRCDRKRQRKKGKTALFVFKIVDSSADSSGFLAPAATVYYRNTHDRRQSHAYKSANCFFITRRQATSSGIYTWFHYLRRFPADEPGRKLNRCDYGNWPWLGRLIPVNISLLSIGGPCQPLHVSLHPAGAISRRRPCLSHNQAIRIDRSQSSRFINLSQSTFFHRPVPVTAQKIADDEIPSVHWIFSTDHVESTNTRSDRMKNFLDRGKPGYAIRLRYGSQCYFMVPQPSTGNIPSSIFIMRIRSDIK
jgi:hypothetical protein